VTFIGFANTYQAYPSNISGKHGGGFDPNSNTSVQVPSSQQFYPVSLPSTFFLTYIDLTVLIRHSLITVAEVLTIQTIPQSLSL